MQITFKQIAVFVSALVVLIVVGALNYGAVAGWAVGLMLGAYVMKRYPEKFKVFGVKSDEERLAELRLKVSRLEKKVKPQ